MVAKRVDSGGSGGKRRMRPASTPEEREQQMVSLAFDLAQKQLEEGTASAMVITHFLKFGSEKDKLERQRLENENLLLKARVDNVTSTTQNGELYQEAIKMMSVYTGDAEEDPADG